MNVLRALVLTGCVLAAPVNAHDLITAEAVERYLAQTDDNLVTIRSNEPATQRAAASVSQGRMLDEIGELLNRDIASHGKVQGLPSHVLLVKLKTRGAPLAFGQGRYLANLSYFRDALELAPDAPSAADALIHWLRGAFHDSFDHDPLEVHGQSAQQVGEQIALGERFLQRYPSHPAIEEAQFIVLVQTVRAARMATDGTSRDAFAHQAREAGQVFTRRFPDSMRAAAVPVLTERLPAAKAPPRSR